MMIFVNMVEKVGISKNGYELFIKLLAPFAPHLTEQIWSELGHSESVHLEDYPIADQQLRADKEVVIGVQINGKLRGDITVAPEADETMVLETLKNNASLQEKLINRQIVKIIYVPGRILNLIVK